MTAVNPISDLALADTGELTFSNAAVEADVAVTPAAYHAVWSRFDNATQTATEIGATSGRQTAMNAPARLPDEDGQYVKIALSASSAEHASWSTPIEVYFRHIRGHWRLVGLDRAAK